MRLVVCGRVVSGGGIASPCSAVVVYITRKAKGGEESSKRAASLVRKAGPALACWVVAAAVAVVRPGE